MILLITFVLSSCPDRINDSTGSNGAKNKFDITGNARKFGATYMTMNNPYFVELDNEIKKYVSRKGDKVTTLDPELDVQKQISCVEELISKGVELVFLNPADYIGIKPALVSARKANIPVIVVDAPVFDSDLVAATVVSDNYKAGVLCAENVIRKLGKDAEAEIVILEHPSARSAVERISGFEDEIAKQPGMKIAARKSSDGQLELAMSVMESVLEENKKIDVVMGLNDPTAIGAIAALKAAGRLDGVLVYGVDGSEDAKRLIQSGEMTATIAQFPKEIGRSAAELAYKVLAGEHISDYYLKTKVELVNSTNIDEYIK